MDQASCWLSMCESLLSSSDCANRIEYELGHHHLLLVHLTTTYRDTDASDWIYISYLLVDNFGKWL
jgi:hypothetical protein